jgi:hypothetical protein
MNLKTKLLTLLIAIIMAVPLVYKFNPAQQVLGVNSAQNQSANSSSNNYTSSATPVATTEVKPKETKKAQSILENNRIAKNTPKLGSIASGVREGVVKEVPVQSFTGKVRWDAQTKIPVSTDKFELGEGISVFYNDKQIELVVQDKRLLASDTLLLVDKATYVNMGGNIEKEYIEVTIKN